MNRFQPTAIITGASSGIGLALTKGYLDAGYRVVATARTASTAGTLSASAELALVDGDIGERATAVRVADTAIEHFGRIDVLINNAGIFVPRAFTDITAEDYERVLATNLHGFFHMTQETLRRMVGKNPGHVLSISTTLVEQPIRGLNAFLTSATKGAINAATKQLALEYVEQGIRFNAIAAGIIDTPMHQPESHAALKGFHPIARLGRVEEVFDAAHYLTRAEFITGELLNLDGGAHAGKW
ncbi:MAG: SDR family oxidoreductase [Bryobacter sp.]|nr:SDR family oxidoreductase [Bryobacter sp.]